MPCLDINMVLGNKGNIVSNSLVVINLVANQMLKNNRIPFFMVSLHNEVALNFQKKLAQPLPQNYFISMPKAHMN